MINYYFVKNEFDIYEFCEKIKLLMEDKDSEDDDDLVLE